MADEIGYVTLEEAEAYVAGALLPSARAAWDAADAATRTVALRRAHARMERYHFAGVPAEAEQTARWPRSGLVDPHGQALDDTTVPQAVKDAQCEEAVWLVQSQAQALGSSMREQLQAQGVTRVKRGDVEEQYDLTRTQARSNTALGAEALALLAPYLLRTPAAVGGLGETRRPPAHWPAGRAERTGEWGE